MGTLSGDVIGGYRTYILGLFGTLPLILFSYIFPILVSISIKGDISEWNSNSFTHIAFLLTQSLGLSMVVAAVLNNVGCINANLTTISRQVWAMAKGKEDGVALHRYLPHFCSLSDRHQTPYVSVISCSILTFCFSILSYPELVQLYLLVRLFTLFSEYGAFIYFKWKYPTLERPFSVPGGILGAVIITLPTFGFGMFTLVSSQTSVLKMGFILMSGIFFLYPVRLMWKYLTHKYSCCISNHPSSWLLNSTITEPAVETETEKKTGREPTEPNTEPDTETPTIIQIQIEQ
eukprot:TRINITY_DN11280_c0_g1_i2.p1 TRINITY_DN11280_c0_g1~~TRINITY_DN11280_c0_g1_i2.p1  ORF type:complete len:290 (-),score=24.01 TRINITY_DN11280_c0_g1_i2:116-985(-)